MPLGRAALGYVLIEYIRGSDEDWIDNVLPPLLKEGQGIVASTETGEFHVAVTRQRLPLDEVLGKCMLDDGDQLLERDWGPYQEAIRAEFTRALAAAGWTGDEAMIGAAVAVRWAGRGAPGEKVQEYLRLIDDEDFPRDIRDAARRATEAAARQPAAGRFDHLIQV